MNLESATKAIVLFDVVATGGNPVTSGQAAYARAAALETIGNRFKKVDTFRSKRL